MADAAADHHDVDHHEADLIHSTTPRSHSAKKDLDLEAGATGGGARIVAAPAKPAPAAPKYGNPAVVGLGGFAITTFVLQLHNLKYCGIGPVIALGLVFGGAAQLLAGLMEMATGNTFGFCAFSGYGCFWISYSLIVLFKRYKIFPITDEEVGIFLVAYTIFTSFLWAATFKRSKAEWFLFTTLIIGFILLDFEKLYEQSEEATERTLEAAAVILLMCALTAFYVMGHAVLKEVYGFDVLPLGDPLIKKK